MVNPSRKRTNAVRLAECVRGIKSGSVVGSRTVLGCPFAIGKFGPKKNKTMWAVVCRCDCGRISVTQVSNLKCGHGDRCIACHSSRINTKHGGKPSTRPSEKLHGVWCSMRQRCNSTSCRAYPAYGGRGITVCQEWDDYAAFRAWAVASGYRPGLTIDRIDNDAGYSPQNCQWMTRSENSKKQHTDKRKKNAA